jgi:predicted metalloendopeptidase
MGVALIAVVAFGSKQGLMTAAAQAGTAKAALGPWGVELTAMDKSIQPGDDFFRYTGGTWMRTTQIPADRARWGAFSILGAKSEDDVRAALDDAAKGKSVPGSAAQKAVDYYRTYMDTTAIEARGIEPAKLDLAAIAACKTHEDIAKLSGTPSFRANLPISMNVTLDAKRPDVYIVAIGQGGLGMPDRDYYLKDDAKFADARAKYRTYVERMLALSGDTQASVDADSIVAVEKRIAEIHWPREKSRDRDLTYNPKNRAELLAFAPEFPWEARLAAFGAPTQDEFIVTQLEAVQSLAKLYRRTSVDVWRAYLTFHYLNANADVLPKAFDELAFDFNGKTLTGTPVQRARWKRAVSTMSGTPFNAPMGEAVGELYVKRAFSPEAKAQMVQLVENLRVAYKVRIAKLPWMTEDTKKAALRKLETMNVKIGYPDRWRDYSTLEIKVGDAFGNRQRETAFQRARDLARLAKGADRNDWGMAPQTVNAYYNSNWNEIVFPAAILQPPFFDPKADPAVNYGGIGAVIGHEMGHAFDDQGAKSDEKGVLRKWWVEEDERRFKELTGRLADQYSKFEALPGLFVNGKLTLGENIGDLGGLNVALEAYKISLKGKEPPTIDGFTGTQRFFLGFGQIWRQLSREEALRQQVVSDGHSPGEFRANGTVRNMDEWYAAFGVQPTAKLYLPPDQRVRIW